MTETYNPQIQKIKSLINNAPEYIENLDPLFKRVLTLAILIPAGMMGALYSLTVIANGVKLLIESGVSEILLKQILGWAACIVGAMAFYKSIVIPFRVFRGIFAKPKSGEGKIRVIIEQ